MKLVANAINGSYLQSLLPTEKHEVDGVLAAIAYGSLSNNEKEDLIGNCLQNKLRLDIWMRYDHTVPVSVPMLQRLVNNHNNNIFCRLIPDCLHSKVVWWKGYGAYIGSANLTERAWKSNIEAGVFLTEEDLHTGNMQMELVSFFDGLRDLAESRPLTHEIIEEMERLSKKRSALEKLYDDGRSERSIEEWRGPTFTPLKHQIDKRKAAFQNEWNETLTVLRSLADKVKDYRPVWVEESIPSAWQADQFLHAYYYKKVTDGRKRPFEEFFQSNKQNPKAAVEEILDWWQNLPSPPTQEDVMFDKYAPYIKQHLSEDHILNISEEEFESICTFTHATVDHVAKIELPFFNLPDRSQISIPERMPIFAKWLYRQRNSKGMDIKQLIHFVLYGGDKDSLWERLYLAGCTGEYKMPHYGLNSIAELVGWARPEDSPPRNGRTSKALRALGYDVKVY